MREAARQTPAPDGQGVLLEREGDLRALHGVLSAARTGSGSLLLIEAAAGLGKSALLLRARQAGADEGMAVMNARGSELERALAFGLVRQLFEPLLRGAGADRDALLTGAGPAAGLLEGDAGHRPADELELLHALYWLCSNAAEREPLLLALDDLHWSDPPSLRFLAYLTPRLGSLPVAVVGTHRPGEPDAPADLLERLAVDDATAVLRPGALSAPASSALVRDRLPGADERFCGAAHTASAGNPFLLHELASALDAEGGRPTSAAAERVGRLAPDSVLRATLTRLKSLPGATLELARAAAVMGGEARLRHAAELAGLTLEEAARAADLLAAVGIVRGGDPVAFAHPLVRSALEASLPEGERGLMHRRSAELLAAENADPERVAAHLLQSPRGGDAWTIERLERAAAAAHARGAAPSAAGYLRRALDEPPAAARRAELLAAFAEAEAGAGDPGALDHLTEAVDLTEHPDARADMLRRLGWTLYGAGRMSDAAEAFGRGLRERPGARDELSAELSTAHLAVRTIVGEVSPEELEASSRAGWAGSGAGARRAEREALTQLALARVVACTAHEEARDLAARALGEGDMLAEEGVSLTYSVAMSCLIWTEALDAVELEFDAAVDATRRTGAPWTRAYVMFGRSWARYWRGLVSEAAADAGVAIEAWRGGFSVHLPLAAYWRALALIELGDLDGAEATLDIPEIEELERTYRVHWHAAHGRLAWTRGDREGADDHFQRLVKLTPGIGFLRNPAALPWRSDAAIAAAAVGDAERARGLVDEDLALARSFGAPRALGMALRGAALVEKGERRIELLRDAVAVLDDSPSRLELCRALVDLGAVLRSRGRRMEAREPLRRALDISRTLQARMLRDRARSELVASGARPRREAMSGVDSLTPSERRVAELAAAGRSNPEIAQELFVTRKTVEWHLGNAYRKLGLSTREELGEELRAPDGARAPGTSAP